MATIGFIGAGNMAEAIARGLLRTAAFQRSAPRPRLCPTQGPDPDEFGGPEGGCCSRSGLARSRP